MNPYQYGRKLLAVLAVVCALVITTACGTVVAQDTPPQYIARDQSGNYRQLDRGNSVIGQDFGDWVVKTSQGLVKDAYVRDNNTLGAVITSQVRPTEVKSLAKSLTQGFSKKFPNQDLTVLMYAPDKKLILTALYNANSHQVEFKQAS